MEDKKEEDHEKQKFLPFQDIAALESVRKIWRCSCFCSWDKKERDIEIQSIYQTRTMKTTTNESFLPTINPCYFREWFWKRIWLFAVKLTHNSDLFSNNVRLFSAYCFWKFWFAVSACFWIIKFQEPESLNNNFEPELKSRAKIRHQSRIC